MDMDALFAACSASQISDAMDRAVGTTALRPMHGSAKLIGRARTVSTRSGDNLFIHAALRRLRPGDVLVVDGGGDPSRALVGEIMKRVAQSKGCVGFVIDGAIRDVESFVVDGFPCFARNVTHRGPYKNGPGSIGGTVSIDGMVVADGDVIVADSDGVVAVPAHRVASVAAAAGEIAVREAAVLASILENRYDDRWLDEIAVNQGFDFALPVNRPQGTDAG